MSVYRTIGPTLVFFCQPMKKELKSSTLSADKTVACRPTVGGVNLIAVLHSIAVNR